MATGLRSANCPFQSGWYGQGGVTALAASRCAICGSVLPLSAATSSIASTTRYSRSSSVGGARPRRRLPSRVRAVLDFLVAKVSVDPRMGRKRGPGRRPPAQAAHSPVSE